MKKEPATRIIDTLPEPILEVDKKLLVRMANKEAHRRWKDLIEGKTGIDEIIPCCKGNGASLVKMIHATFREKKPKFAEIETKQEEFFDVRTNWVKKAGTEPERVVVHVLDVTHSRILEKALKESEEKLRAQYNSFPIPTYTWQWTGEDLELIDFNDAAMRITQGKIAGFKGIPAGKLFKEKPEILEDLRACYQSKKTFGREMQYSYQSTGETKYLVVKYVYIPPDLVVVHTEDTSDRRLAVSALERSEKKYRTMFDHSPEAILLLDKVARVEDMNKHLVEMLEAEKETVLGKTFLELPFLSLEDKKKTQIMFVRRMQGLDVEPYEITLISKSGRKRVVQVNATPVKGAAGQNINDLVILVDVTKSKQAEKELLRHRERLEEAVKERTNELKIINDQLREEIGERLRAEEVITSSLKEKDALLKEIHHRVKNNLQLIISLLNLQAKQIRDPKSLNVFSEIKNKVYSIALIHEKLYQSKNLSNIDFGEYINDLTTQLFRAITGSVQLSPRVKLHLDTSSVSLDISQAMPCALLVNELITNALKYAFPGDQSGEITVSLMEKENRRITLIIADTGVGLPLGFQIDEAKTLGMQIVRSLVRQLRGSIKIESHEGTCYIIDFTAI